MYTVGGGRGSRRFGAGEVESFGRPEIASLATVDGGGTVQGPFRKSLRLVDAGYVRALGLPVAFVPLS